MDPLPARAPAELKQNYLFTTQEGVELLREAMADLPNVEVRPFSGLTVGFAKEVGATVIVRALRAVTDFEAEFDMALMNKKMAPEIESIYMMSSLDYLFISGTRIREVSALPRDAASEHTARAIAGLRASPEGQEGLGAFLEKRRPSWKR